MKIGLFLLFFSVHFVYATNGNDKEFKNFVSALPKDFTYGFIKVPEAWDDPNGKHINIFYYGRMKGSGIYQNQTPTVFFNGGPANDSHYSYSRLMQSEVSFDKQPIIFIDQRGTGFSSEYPDINTDDGRDKVFDYYGSEGIARDAEEIRKALFQKKAWNIFGQSYGAIVVYRYLKLFPESILAATTDGYALHSQPEEKLLYYKSQMKIKLVSDFFKKYPSNVSRVKRIKTQIQGKISTGLYNNNFVDVILTRGIQDTSSWKSVNDFLIKVAPDDQLQIDLDFFKDFIFNNFPDEINLKTFKLFSPETLIHYSEIGDYYDLFSEKYLKNIMEKDDVLKGLPIFPLTEESLQIEDDSKLHGLKFLKNKISFDDIAQALVKNPDLKINFFIGKEDVYTPPAAYDEMKEHFSSESRIKFITRDGDHFNFFKELLNLSEFLKESDVIRNSLSCIKHYI